MLIFSHWGNNLNINACNYIDDKRNGEFIQYRENGVIHIIHNLKNDFIDGIYKEYYMDGALKLIMHYTLPKSMKEQTN